MGKISKLRLNNQAEKPPRDQGVSAEELAVLANDKEPPRHTELTQQKTSFTAIKQKSPR